MSKHIQDKETDAAWMKEAATGMQSMPKDPRKKWYKIATAVMLAIIIILILLLCKQCSSGPDVPVLNPDYPPVSDDPNADKIPGDDDDKLTHEEGGGAVSIQLQDTVTIDLSDKIAYLSFANPNRSTQDMMIQLVIQDEIIAQSGRIRPGYRLPQVNLLDGAERKLTEGVYKGSIKIFYYDPVENERAMIDTTVPVTVTVQP